MAKLTLYYGTMETGKTTKLIQDHYNYSKYLLKVILIKPKIDTKGGNTVITRVGENIKCDLLLPKSASLLSKKYFNRYKYMQFILVDEAQFLTKKQINELWFIAHKYNIDTRNNHRGLKDCYITFEVYNNLTGKIQPQYVQQTLL